MSDMIGIVVALIVGGTVGILFFGGLWWTIQRGINSQWTALWFIGSLLLRMTAVIAGFYFISQHHWPRLVACVVGFVLARLVMVNWLGGPPEDIVTTAKKGTFDET